MAVVHLARQTDLERLVALKELSALHADDPAYAQRFLREARLAGSITDANVVTGPRVPRARRHAVHRDGVPGARVAARVRRHLSLAQISGVLEAVLAGLGAPSGRGSCTATSSPRTCS